MVQLNFHRQRNISLKIRDVKSAAVDIVAKSAMLKIKENQMQLKEIECR